jgi:ketosteroid isomerase-like protein
MGESNDLYNTICAANEVFMERFGQGNSAGVAGLYTEDGQFLPPNSDEVIGKNAIQGAFQGLMDAGIKAIQLETLEVENYGDTASEVGRFTLKDEGDQILDRGKFIVIWKLVAGKWKLHRDIINSSLAP